MRTVWIILAFLGAAAGTWADDLSEGALICHNVPDLGYTTWIEDFGGEAPLSWWCAQYEPLAGCEDQINAIYNDADTFYDNFFVLASWAEPKTFCAAEFGLGAYDAGLLSFVQHGACGWDPQSIPTTDPPWPAPNSGIAIAWAIENAPSGNFVPVYFFGCYMYGSYYGSTTVPLIPDPSADFIGFASCDAPPVTYPAYDWGALGLNEAGEAACHVVPEPWACCLGCECVMLTADECDELHGYFQGQGVPCDPNPCPSCVYACCFYDGGCQDLFEEECAELGGTVYDDYWYCDPNPCPDLWGACCFPEEGHPCLDDTFEEDCHEMGGAIWFVDETCETAPCDDYTPASTHSWGTIKDAYR